MFLFRVILCTSITSRFMIRFTWSFCSMQICTQSGKRWRICAYLFISHKVIILSWCNWLCSYILILYAHWNKPCLVLSVCREIWKTFYFFHLLCLLGVIKIPIFLFHFCDIYSLYKKKTQFVQHRGRSFFETYFLRCHYSTT